jgi:hypothetical protein
MIELKRSYGGSLSLSGLDAVSGEYRDDPDERHYFINRAYVENRGLIAATTPLGL